MLKIKAQGCSVTAQIEIVGGKKHNQIIEPACYLETWALHRNKMFTYYSTSLFIAGTVAHNLTISYSFIIPVTGHYNTQRGKCVWYVG